MPAVCDGLQLTKMYVRRIDLAVLEHSGITSIIGAAAVHVQQNSKHKVARVVGDASVSTASLTQLRPNSVGTYCCHGKEHRHCSVQYRATRLLANQGSEATTPSIVMQPMLVIMPAVGPEGLRSCTLMGLTQPGRRFHDLGQHGSAQELGRQGRHTRAARATQPVRVMMPAPRPEGLTSCALMPAAVCSSWMRAAMAAALMLLSNICCVSCGSRDRHRLSLGIVCLLGKDGLCSMAFNIVLHTWHALWPSLY